MRNRMKRWNSADRRALRNKQGGTGFFDEYYQSLRTPQPVTGGK
jgi:hypothetical protein